MVMAERFIREMVEKGNVKYSEHAIHRMGERKILRPFIDHSILNGEVLEIQDFTGEDIKVIFHSVDESADSFYVIVAASFPQIVVVSVCFFLEDVWAQLGDIRVRRGKK